MVMNESEPQYDFDPNIPCWRPGEEGVLTKSISVRGTEYIFPAVRLPCNSCDGGIRRKLNLRLRNGICYCEEDYTIVVYDHSRLTDEQAIIIATFHLEQQMSQRY